MTTFDEYWESKQAEYLKIAKKLALDDFTKISNKKNFTITVNIDTDDDFDLVCGTNLEASGETKKEACWTMIDILKNAQLSYAKSSSVTSNGNTVHHSKAQNWFDLRDYAVKELKKGNTDFTYGGNQVIESYIIQNELAINSQLPAKKRKP